LARVELERLAKDKHSCLLRTFMNYGEKSFVIFVPGRCNPHQVQPVRAGRGSGRLLRRVREVWRVHPRLKFNILLCPSKKLP
jgi:hypothetical protein